MACRFRACLESKFAGIWACSLGLRMICDHVDGTHFVTNQQVASLLKAGGRFLRRFERLMFADEDCRGPREPGCS